MVLRVRDGEKIGLGKKGKNRPRRKERKIGLQIQIKNFYVVN